MEWCARASSSYLATIEREAEELKQGSGGERASACEIQNGLQVRSTLMRSELFDPRMGVCYN
jgi:hypothetical protein